MTRRTHIRTLVASCVAVFLVLFYGQAVAGHVRQYYIAVDEIDWNYMPHGMDNMIGMPPTSYAKFYMTRGPHLIGPV